MINWVEETATREELLLWLRGLPTGALISLEPDVNWTSVNTEVVMVAVAEDAVVGDREFVFPLEVDSNGQVVALS